MSDHLSPESHSALTSPLWQTTPFPNGLLDTVMPQLKDTEWRLLCVIVRQTVGWQTAKGRRKTRDWLTQKQLMARTGRNSEAVSRAVDTLIRRNLIEAQTQDGQPLLTPAARRRHCGRIYYRLGVAVTSVNHAKSELASPPSEVGFSHTTKETVTKYLSSDKESSLSSQLKDASLQNAVTNASPAAPNPQVKQLLHVYRTVFQQHSPGGDCPPIVWGRDGKIIQELLHLYSYDRLLVLLAQFFENPDLWLRQQGYTIAAFKAALPHLLMQRPAATPVKSKLGLPRLRSSGWSQAHLHLVTRGANQGQQNRCRRNSCSDQAA